MADVGERFEIVDQARPGVRWDGPQRFAVVDVCKGRAVIALADTREEAERTAARLTKRPPDADPRDLPGVTLP